MYICTQYHFYNLNLNNFIMNKRNIFISMFALTLAVLSWMPVNAQQNDRDLRGDVNYDDEVDINDVTDLIDYVLPGDWGGVAVCKPLIITQVRSLG